MAKIENNIVENPKSFWSFIKNKKQSSVYPSVMSYGGDSFSSGESICNKFAEYFHSNFQQPSSCHTTSPDHTPSSEVIVDIANIEVLDNEVLELLKRLDLSKSAGPDHTSIIYSFLCKEFKNPISIIVQTVIGDRYSARYLEICIRNANT